MRLTSFTDYGLRVLMRLAGEPDRVPDRVLVARRELTRLPRWLGPPDVLVVDDVVTTGATLASAVGSLRRAGIRHVYAVAAAVADRSLVALRRAG